MQNAIRCDGCGRSFAYTAKLAGRRVKCPKCGAGIEVPEQEGAGDLAGLAGGEPIDVQRSSQPASPRAVSAASSSNANPSITTVARTRPVRSREWSAWDRILLQTGGGCILFGVLAVILPYFGLQFRKLSNLGAAGPIAGWGLVGFGAFLCLYVTFFRGYLLKGMLVVAAVGVVSIAGLIGWALWVAKSHPTPLPLPPPLAPPAFSAPVRPSPGDPRTPYRPGPPSGSPDAPHGVPPSAAPQFSSPGRAPSPASALASRQPTYEGVVREHGAARVVRIRFGDVRGLDLSAAIREKVRAAGDGGAAVTWSVSVSGDEGTLFAAPITNLEAFARSLDVGEIESIDRVARIVTIKVDPQRVPKSAP